MEQKQNPKQIGGCMGAVFALMFLGTGLLIILASLDIIHAPEESFKAPRYIVLAAGIVFFLAGVFITMGAVFSEEELRLPVMLWTQYILALAIMISFSVPFLYAGFGPGEREFSTTMALGPIRVSERGNQMAGRVLFGGVGLLCGLVTVWYAVSAPGKIVRGEFKSMFEQNRKTTIEHDDEQ